MAYICDGFSTDYVPYQFLFPVSLVWQVDWSPDLHQRFVAAVEQLGVEKATPSRILEMMGVHCLTRHNIASHLQV